MHQRKHEISACIKSVGSAVCPEHLVEIEQAYKAAQIKKKAIAAELDSRRQTLAERSEYIHRLKTNALVAAREVPLLRSELLKLKEQIISLTYVTERWGKVCIQQEEDIAALQGKRLNLEKTLGLVEEKVALIAREISQAEAGLKLLSDALHVFSSKKDELAVFQGLELPSGDTEVELELAPHQIVDALKNMVTEINLVMAETESFNSKASELESYIAQQNSAIDATRSRIGVLQGVNTGLQEAIAVLLAKKIQYQHDIEALSDGYQVYSQIFADNQVTEELHQNMVIKVNEANACLKEALLTNNRLELSLRLENYKINTLLQELEYLL